MLDRRSFLAAALGTAAGTLAMPAIARAGFTAEVIAERYLEAPMQRPGLSVSPTVARTARGTVAASWQGFTEDSFSAFLQTFSPNLSPRSEAVIVGYGLGQTAMRISATGGIALTGIGGAFARPLTPEGTLAGPQIPLSGFEAPLMRFEPLGCFLADGSFFSAWVTEANEPPFRGATGMVQWHNGRRRTSFFNLFKPYRTTTGRIAIHAVVPAQDGALVVATIGEGDAPRTVRMRKVCPDGCLGPAIVIADGVDWAIGGSVGLRDRVAVFWAVGGTLYGGLYRPDGRRVVAFEPVPCGLNLKWMICSYQLIVPIGNGRILNCASEIYDLTTGKIVPAQRRESATSTSATSAAWLGNGIVAVTQETSYESESYIRTIRYS